MVLFLFMTSLIFSSLLIIAFHVLRENGRTASLSEIFLLVTTALGGIVVFSTELLSIFSILTPLAIKLTWAIVLAVSLVGVTLIILYRRNTFTQLRKEITSRLQDFKSLSWQGYLLVGMIVFTLLATLITNYQYQVPTNGDSMRYHLTRTLYWLQNGSVRHYATFTLHQISFPPFAEYAILHLDVMAGTDLLSRMVQWIAIFPALIAIAEITKQLGGDLRQRLVAALFASATPMLIVQSTSTMNDLVLSVWLLIFIAAGLRLVGKPTDLFWIVFAGIALGLAILTKSTAFIFALPVSIWLAIRIIRAQGLSSQTWKTGLVILFLVLLINAGHFYRNTATFGSPLGVNLGTVNETFSLRSLASNTIRNIQMHMPAEAQDQPAIVNLAAKSAWKISWNLHELTGLDPQDPRTTYKGSYVGFTSPGGLDTSEGRAGSLVILVLAFFTVLLVIFRPDRRKHFPYILVLIFTFLLFSFLLKAQSPINRLLLPYLLMWPPVLALVLTHDAVKWWVVIPSLVFLASLPWSLNNATRPLIREFSEWPVDGVEAYFLRKKQLLPVYQAASEVILENHCDQIGIVYQANHYFFEYPLWIMLREKGFSGSIQHMLVDNESNMYEDPDFSPCLILTINKLEDLPGYSLQNVLELEGQGFDYRIYTRDR
jgi:4-amino-4-deoxy-L-arabinose transferase-like glycosyltransferase